MVIAVLLAGAAVVAPEPVGPWLASEDVPKALLKLNIPSAVGIRVHVSPDGRTQACEVERSSGNQELDDYTCKLTRQRARFEPARWLDGKPVWGVYRQTITYVFSVAGAEVLPSGPDVIVRVKSLPPQIASPARMRVALGIEASGRIASCSEAGKEPSPAHAMIALACKQLVPAFEMLPARDRSGAAIDSVQTARVDFVAEPKKKKRWRLFGRHRSSTSKPVA